MTHETAKESDPVLTVLLENRRTFLRFRSAAWAAAKPRRRSSRRRSSGDSRTTAEAVARKLAISEVIAEVLPDQKADAVRRLQEQGKRVAMAGDGINDAPALAQADVGIAMGTGTDVAMESAGVTLVKGDLRGIVRARRLSEATVRNIRQNLFFAFVYNALGVPVAAGVLYPFLGVLLSPMIAAAAMSVSSVSVIGNALRLRRGGSERPYQRPANCGPMIAVRLLISVDCEPT